MVRTIKPPAGSTLRLGQLLTIVAYGVRHTRLHYHATGCDQDAWLYPEGRWLQGFAHAGVESRRLRTRFARP